MIDMRKSSCKIGVVGYYLLGLRSQIPYVMIEKIFVPTDEGGRVLSYI